MKLKRDWPALDASRRQGQHAATAQIPAGEHEVERIPNPLGHDSYWLVLVGTLIGASEGSWKQWGPGQLNENPESPNFGKPINWGEFEVVITE